MRGLRLCLLVMTITASAGAKEPEAPPFPYALIALTGGPHSVPRAPFRMATLPAPALRLWLTPSDAPASEGAHVAPRAIRLALEPESIASFPIDPEAVMSRVPAPEARPRRLTIRRDLDEGGMCEKSDVPYRLIRGAMEESSDQVLSARVVRTTLD
jgi:hypothetical protein